MKNLGDTSHKREPLPAAQFVAQMKARPRTAVQMKRNSHAPAGARGVVQLHLADDLRTKKFKAAIAGEHHDEIPKGKETQAWGEEGIDVHYEDAVIPLQGGGKKITPDPIVLRLGFAYTFLMEAAGPYLAKASEPGNGAGLAGEENIAYGLDYLLSALKGDLGTARGAKAEEARPVIAALAELDDVLKNNRLVAAKNLEGIRVPLAAKVLRNLRVVGTFIEREHGASAFKDVEFNSGALQVARSQQMLDRIDGASASLENTIYKIGNDHVKDIERAKWKPKTNVTVLERETYLEEYRTIPPKKSAVPVPGPSVPKTPVAPVPKASAAPASQTPSVPVVPLTHAVPEPKKSAVPAPKKPAKKEAPSAPSPAAIAAGLLNQVDALMGTATAETKKANGYKSLVTEVGFFKDQRMGPENVLIRVTEVVRAALGRKVWSRSKETQALYDALGALLGLT
jgi:hypothetical protein